MYQEVTKMDVENYILSKGWKYRENGNQFQILSGCPFCNDGKPTHFYIRQENGLYSCKKCNNAGNLYQLKKNLGDINGESVPVEKITVKKSELKEASIEQTPIEFSDEMINGFADALQINTEILDWFSKECLKPETLKSFKIGWDGKRITIPIYIGGKLVAMRYRKSPKDTSDMPKYLSATGSKIALYNSDILDVEEKPQGVLIAEGEKDAMVFAQEISPAVVTSTGGCMSFKDEWLEKFKGIQKIYLCYDNDDPGREGAKKVAQKLGFARCWNVILPQGIKDITEFFQKGYTAQDFKKVLAKARRFPEISEERITHIRDILPMVKETIINGKKIRGVLTGFDDLDYMLEGCRPGDLIVIAGKTGVGKSYFAQTLALNIAKKKCESMFYSLEMLPSELVHRFVSMNTDIDANKYSGFGESNLTETELMKVDATISSLKNLPIFFYTGDDALNMDILNEISANAVNKYNAQALFIDHLHFFARGDVKTRSTQIGDIVREIKLLARRLNVPIFLVSHLRKTGDYSTTPTIDDLRDSSLVGQDADIVILLSRNKEAKTEAGTANTEERLKMLVDVAKNRHGREGTLGFQFIEKNMKLVPMSEIDTVHDEPPQQPYSETAKY